MTVAQYHNTRTGEPIWNRDDYIEYVPPPCKRCGEQLPGYYDVCARCADEAGP